MGAGLDDCAAGGVVGEGGMGVSVDEFGVVGRYGKAFALGALGPLGTVVVGVPRRVPGSPGTQGWPRCCALA